MNESSSWWIDPLVPRVGFTVFAIKHFEDVEPQPITRRKQGPMAGGWGTRRFASPDQSAHSGMVRSESAMKANAGVKRQGFGISR